MTPPRRPGWLPATGRNRPSRSGQTRPSTNPRIRRHRPTTRCALCSSSHFLNHATSYITPLPHYPITPSTPLAPYREDVLGATNDDCAARNGGRCHQDLAHRVGGQELIRRTGLDHVHVAVFAEKVDFSISGDGRRAERAAGAHALLVQALPRLDVIRGQHAVDGEHIQLIAIDDRCGDVRSAAVRAPGDELALRLSRLQGDVAAGAGLDGVNRLDGRVPV